MIHSTYTDPLFLGKLNNYYYRLDGAKVYVVHGTEDVLCGKINVRRLKTTEAQTYTIRCHDYIKAESFRVELDTNNCLSVSNIDVTVVKGVPFKKDQLYQISFFEARLKIGSESTKAMYAIDNDLKTHASTECGKYRAISASFERFYANVRKIVVITGE